MGILAVLFTVGPDPEKRPVQALEESSVSFREETPEFLVPGVSFGRDTVISSRLVCPFGHKRRAWPEKSKSELSEVWVQSRRLSCPHHRVGPR